MVRFSALLDKGTTRAKQMCDTVRLSSAFSVKINTYSRPLSQAILGNGNATGYHRTGKRREPYQQADLRNASSASNPSGYTLEAIIRYMIGAFTILFSILITLVIFENNETYYPMEFYYSYRFMGSTAVVLGVFWFIAGLAFLYGVHKEIKQCLLPFALLYLLDLCLLAVRDILMVWHDRRWYSMVFVNMPALMAVLYITCYLFMTLIALARLFATEPKPQTGDNFVRFNNGIANPALEEEAVLVAE
uniref:Uncharacterized protein n=1 Tax=Anopheles culicifacies TaxID=139723 RepID=A0A182MRB9_9DIPT